VHSAENIILKLRDLMSLDLVVEARIHPAIGIARIGNSDEFFIGPEVPYATDPPKSGYRDAAGRLKRQAARFRVYGYDSSGNAVVELTASNAEIQWAVHVANKKAAWYDFDAALDLPEAASLRSARRNAGVQGKDREKLVIDPGSRSVSGRSQRSSPFDTGEFFGQAVYLGDLLTDEEGRLIFVGGKGNSGTPLPGYTLVTFANNPGWHDDTSDGPVSATISVNGRSIPVDPAWVVTAPPNYSPDLVTPQTMYDVIQDAVAGSLLPMPTKPSFTRDILPLFRQFHEAQWVNLGFFVQFGWMGPNDFMRPDLLMKLAAPPTGINDPFVEVRRQIFYSFRDPASNRFEPLKWPPLYGDAFGSFDSPPSPRAGFTVTKTIYGFLREWMNGNFIGDFDPNSPDPPSIDHVAVADQPATLDRAALHFCMGGPFHPGCEMTWPMRRASMYRAPLRLRQRPIGSTEPDYGDFLTQATIMADDGPLSASGPGDISKWMAVPWQTDTASCRAGYPDTEFPEDGFIPTFWPSRVPNTVLSETSYGTVIDTGKPLDQRTVAFYNRSNWLRSLGVDRPYVEQITHMVHHFGELGVIERREAAAGPNFPSVMYVETLPSATTARFAEMGPEPSAVSPEFARARFGGLRRLRP
jgi:L-Lysine epsilon oxidase N-terminal/L-lysine epsilon oxidase C-terminal domain